MNGKKSRRQPPAMASDVLQSLLSNGKQLSSQFKRWKLWCHWKEVVGETISSHSMPVGYNNSKGTLFVWVESSSWISQLSFMRQHIIDRVNEEMGEDWVSRIYFTTDKRYVPDVDSAPESFRQLLK